MTVRVRQHTGKEMCEMADNLALIAKDIQVARRWMRQRFPAGPLGIIRAGFDIEFPAPDRASVWPTAFGQRLDMTEATFRLCWQHGNLYWKGNFEIRRQLYGEGEVIEHCVGPAMGNPAKVVRDEA